MISSIANLAYELPHELLNDLGLEIFGNKKKLGKSQDLGGDFQKLNFGNSSQKRCKSRYQTFLFLSSFTGFLYFIPNILSRIVDIFSANRGTCYRLFYVGGGGVGLSGSIASKTCQQIL